MTFPKGIEIRKRDTFTDQDPAPVRECGGYGINVIPAEWTVVSLKGDMEGLIDIPEEAFWTDPTRKSGQVFFSELHDAPRGHNIGN